jgi:hypothetical protein
MKHNKNNLEDSESISKQVDIRWHRFAELLLSGSKHYLAYREAFNASDLGQEVLYSSASRLFRNVQFQEYLSELIEGYGYTDLHADITLLNLLESDDPKIVLRAIDIYNRLKGRYNTKQGSPKKRPIPILGSIVFED